MPSTDSAAVQADPRHSAAACATPAYLPACLLPACLPACLQDWREPGSVPAGEPGRPGRQVGWHPPDCPTGLSSHLPAYPPTLTRQPLLARLLPARCAPMPECPLLVLCCPLQFPRPRLSPAIAAGKAAGSAAPHLQGELASAFSRSSSRSRSYCLALGAAAKCGAASSSLSSMTTYPANPCVPAFHCVLGAGLGRDPAVL